MLVLLSGSGACLALHFGCWVWSLENTSLTHSLVLVSSTPVIMAGGSYLLNQPISRGEISGAMLALAGTCSAGGSHPSCFQPVLLALLGVRSDSVLAAVT